ncbi:MULTISPECIES: electron transfer flavoprotein [Bacillus]|uniref:electron transfer flavoprotein n=1 Tax=Bacillus TaxID=1386 RepID=UPI0002FADDF2|nr:MULTISPECIES: electron transfer flavoprotein [Bacillus]
MDVVVCYKIVPEEQDIKVLDDQTLSFDKAELKIGQYDLNAVEAGVQLVESEGGKISALTVGTSQVENTKLKKAILSRGPQELYLVSDDSFEKADTYLTAKTLAAAVKKMDHVDLILCGEGSSDVYAQQVGVQLGEMLSMTTLNGISKITPAGDKVIVERTLENEVEVLEVTLPAVLSVTTDINVTRVPSMKDILGAGKKPSTKWQLEDLNLDATSKYVETVSTLAPKQVDRQHVIIEGDDADSVAELFKNIRKVL